MLKATNKIIRKYAEKLIRRYFFKSINIVNGSFRLALSIR